jgi:hypothetical protein
VPIAVQFLWGSLFGKYKTGVCFATKQSCDQLGHTLEKAQIRVQFRHQTARRQIFVKNIGIA